MKRLTTLGIAATVVAVVVLVISLVTGLRSDAYVERPEEDGGEQIAPRVRVEVLNAAGIEGLARAATRMLREQGVDVVYFGNASSFGRDPSVVIDRVGDPEAARAVADLLDIPRVRTERDTSLYLEATVVLGTDWAGNSEGFPLDVPASSEEAAGSP